MLLGCYAACLLKDLQAPDLPVPPGLLALRGSACRYAEGCTALAVATSRGFVGLHLLAGGGAPCWFEAAPQCVCEGVEIQAVRSQVGGWICGWLAGWLA